MGPNALLSPSSKSSSHLSWSFVLEIELMAYNISKALLLVVGFLLATALLGSSEVPTQEQLAQNHVAKTINKEYTTYRCIRFPERPCIPGRGPPYVPGRPYFPGAPRHNPYTPAPPPPS